MLLSSRKEKLKALYLSQLKCTFGYDTFTFSHMSVQTADDSIMEALV